MHIRLPALALMMLVLWVAPSATRAAQGSDFCTGFIDSVPATITTQGTWCLRRDLATSLSEGAAIAVATNNVTIDCNNFKLGGLAAGAATQMVGIVAIGRHSTTVRNCNIRGFHTGIALQSWSDRKDGGGHLVERNRVVGSTSQGIRVDGDGSTVQQNWVLDTGGARSVEATSITGIVAVGSVDVLDNLVSGMTGAEDYQYTHLVTGIFQTGMCCALDPFSASIRGNRIRNVDPHAAAQVAGIRVESRGTVIRDNDIAGRDTTFDIAILCSIKDASVYRDNTLTDFQIAAQGCVNGTGNISMP